MTHKRKNINNKKRNKSKMEAEVEGDMDNTRFVVHDIDQTMGKVPRKKQIKGSQKAPSEDRTPIL